jgi:His/Glu/Gln/Arg/opine family amino acid ABC transporter permease subunit
VYQRKIRITKLDVVVAALILLLAAYIAYRLTIKLNYKWNWSIIPQYLFFFDETEGRWKANVLIQGFLTTIRLTVWSTLLAIIFGFITGIMRTTPRLFNRLVGRSYVELIRNVPPLVLIFIFYFFVSDQIIPLLGVEEFVRSSSPETQKVLAFFFSSPDLFTAFLICPGAFLAAADDLYRYAPGPEARAAAFGQRVYQHPEIFSHRVGHFDPGTHLPGHAGDGRHLCDHRNMAHRYCHLSGYVYDALLRRPMAGTTNGAQRSVIGVLGHANGP